MSELAKTVLATRRNINTLSDSELQALTRQTYAPEGYFQEKFKTQQFETNCEAIANELQSGIMRLLKEKGLVNDIQKLEDLHQRINDDMRAYNFDDGVNKVTTHFYETDDAFMTHYYDLVAYIRNNIVDEPFYFQATPTIRIHCPNGKNSNHYPRYHTDIGYGHPPQEINFWLPLTAFTAPQGHGFRTISLENSRTILERFDYRFDAFIDAAIHDKAFSKECDEMSMNVTTPFGSMLAFDSRCIHTGEPLQNHTRVSIDIRVLPVSQYETMTIEYQGAGRRKILFTPEHCYHQDDSDTFLSKRD